ncbi:MAG: UDP-N-acetylmuramoyl-tripeptide--D-alanyl-D-alanine ligase [Calditrichaeota bacterium]|nr:MAG: UDP-N-acetylmuramoyl-tripeptide--D-alanyl-D-alanine ligase [Calditrichota bacterium]
MELTLREIIHLEGCGYVASSLPDGELAGVSTDSRTVGRNELFVALRGDNHDGHQYLSTAFERGAAAALVDSKWFQSQAPASSSPVIVVDNTLDMFQSIARYYRQKMDPQVVALTGSTGKTTCKELIHAVLAPVFRTLRNIKSFNNHVGVPTTLLQLTREHQILVAELGTSGFHEIERLSYLVEPDICLLLNIGHAHLEFLHDLEGVARAKMEIFDFAANDVVAVYNADDDVLQRQKYPAGKILTFAVERKADIRGRIISCDEQGRYTFQFEDQTIRLQLAGRHMVYNALAALAIGKLFDIKSSLMSHALENAAAAEHRLQIHDVNSRRIIDDVYNSNPSSCRAALQTLHDMQVKDGGRRIGVLADMLELGAAAESEHVRLAEIAKQLNIDVLFLFGDACRSTAARAQELGMVSCHFSNQEELAQAIQDFWKRDDLVLIKGSRSMHMERVVDALIEKKV